MEKIKIIDLIDKVYNGETPSKIKINNNVYEYSGNPDVECIYNNWYDNENHFWLKEHLQLNDYVEIIKEDKKIEKINLDYSLEIDSDLGHKCRVINKINEIIDYINKENK